MKNFLKIVIGLVLLLVIAAVALITLVDPNEYRGYMVEQVEKNTGYKLEINGDLRWHIWPQVSILVNDVKVTAPGASAAMLNTENMRLDVELMPLFSKQLSVKQVMLKGAIIRLTDETKDTSAPKTDEAEKPKTDDSVSAAADWSFELEKFEIQNSLFIFQQSENKDDLLTVRDINVEVKQIAPRQADISFSANINRDQQDLSLSLHSVVDLRNLPKQLQAELKKLSYQLKAAGGKDSGLVGDLSLKLSYLAEGKTVTVSDIKIVANGDVIQGAINGTLGEIPNFTVNLASDRINVDQLLNSLPKAKPAANTASTAKKTEAKPQQVADQNPLAAFQGLNFHLTTEIKSVIVSGLTINGLGVEVDNNQGKVQLKKLAGQVLGGSFSVPGSINATGKVPYVQINPKIQQIDLDTVNKSFGLPNTLSGKLNLQGTLSGSGLDAVAIQRGWQGNLKVNIANAKLSGINIQQIIQQAAALSNRDIKASDKYESYTEFRELRTDVALRQGNVTLSNLSVDSQGLTVSGAGTVNLPKMYCDVNLNVKLMQGWEGKKDVVDILQATSIPVRIYGPCDKLGYSVNVEKVLKDQLKNQAGKAIDKYLERKGSGSEKDQQKKEVINQVLGRILR